MSQYVLRHLRPSGGDTVTTPVESFAEAMRSVGIEPPDRIIGDGRLHRFSTNGRPGDDAGWYVLHLDGVAAGAFGDWRSGAGGKWHAQPASTLAPVERAAWRARLEQVQREAAKALTQVRSARIAHARAIWKGAHAARGTIVERYLLGRGLKLHIPPTLRFHPALRHSPSGRELPAMVAAVQAIDRSIIGIHRTFLAADGNGKAAVADAKMTLGLVSGGAVRLAPAVPDLAIGEGIETCLAFMQVTGTATWSALSTSGVKRVILPQLPLAATVYLIVDADAAGEAAAYAAARRFAAEGRTVKLARPVRGKDVNDSLLEASRDQ